MKTFLINDTRETLSLSLKILELSKARLSFQLQLLRNLATLNREAAIKLRFRMSKQQKRRRRRFMIESLSSGGTVERDENFSNISRRCRRIS